MALIFESIQTDGIAQLSYLIGDDSEGVAAVFDPRADVGCYLQLAHEKQVSITHIFETHIHVDFVSGAPVISRIPGMFFWVNCANTSASWTRASRRPSIATAAIARASRPAFCSSKGSAPSATSPEAGKHGRMPDSRSKRSSRRRRRNELAHEYAFSRSIDSEACCLSHWQSCSPAPMRCGGCGDKRARARLSGSGLVTLSCRRGHWSAFLADILLFRQPHRRLLILRAARGLSR
jgi:hypothetical protein